MVHERVSAGENQKIPERSRRKKRKKPSAEPSGDLSQKERENLRKRRVERLHPKEEKPERKRRRTVKNKAVTAHTESGAQSEQQRTHLAATEKIRLPVEPDGRWSVGNLKKTELPNGKGAVYEVLKPEEITDEARNGPRIQTIRREAMEYQVATLVPVSDDLVETALKAQEGVFRNHPEKPNLVKLLFTDNLEGDPGENDPDTDIVYLSLFGTPRKVAQSTALDAACRVRESQWKKFPEGVDNDKNFIDPNKEAAVVTQRMFPRQVTTDRYLSPEDATYLPTLPEPEPETVKIGKVTYQVRGYVPVSKSLRNTMLKAHARIWEDNVDDPPPQEVHFIDDFVDDNTGKIVNWFGSNDIFSGITTFAITHYKRYMKKNSLLRRSTMQIQAGESGAHEALHAVKRYNGIPYGGEAEEDEVAQGASDLIWNMLVNNQLL